MAIVNPNSKKQTMKRILSSLAIFLFIFLFLSDAHAGSILSRYQGLSYVGTSNYLRLSTQPTTAFSNNWKSSMTTLNKTQAPGSSNVLSSAPTRQSSYFATNGLSLSRTSITAPQSLSAGYYRLHSGSVPITSSASFSQINSAAAFGKNPTSFNPNLNSLKTTAVSVR